ncbi:uncharacterized protein [Epargyreus clarus]|uniref:uncharacterized protein isoform X2 n=1 Tax=Epargyreus clarus TaxID=520877 RepID=UPI003C30A662
MIEFTIKTLDSNNHSITVEDDTTVFGLKQKLLEQLGIRIDRQRLIFFGRVLHDNKKLADYGVHGKVVHLVERPPPRSQQINNDGDAPPSGRIGRPASSDANDSDSTAPTAARIEFLQRSIEDIRGLLESLRAADTWLPSLGNPTNSARNDESKSHCPKGRRTCRFKSREATPNSDQNEVSTPTPGPSQPGPSQEQELKCESDLAQGTSEASVPSKSKASESTPSTATTTESAPGSCTENHNGHLPEARANLSRTEVYAQLLGDFLELEEQFRHYRTLYIDWIRSTPSYVCLTHINVNDVTLRRKQRFSNLISELHHSFAHAHHVISDINFYVSPITNLLISDPVIMASSNQGLSGGGLNPQRQQRTQQAFVVLPQHIIPHQQQNPTQRIAQIPIPQSMQHLPSELQIPLPPLLGQPPSPMMLHPMPPQMSHEIPQQMRPDVPLDYSHQMRRHTEDQMHRENVLESSPQEPRYPAAQPMQQHSPHHAFAELPIEQQMPPLQIQNQDPQQMHHHEDMHRDLPQMAPQAAPQPHQPQQPQQPHQPADGRRRGGNSGVHTPVLLGIPPQALNINVQSNPVTFQLEIETRSLEAALLNTVVNHVSQIVASQAAGNVPANNTTTTDSQATPQPTDNAQTGPQLQINPPILGLNLGTVHLGTFNLGNLSQAGGMDVDSQSAPQGTANMETDSQGTNRSATNNSNSNQENENQNGPTSRQQARLDVESLVRGIGQTHGVNDMDILMSIDVAGQHRTQAFVLNSASNNPGVAPGAQNPRAAGLGNPTETNPPPHPHYANPNAQRASRHRGRLFRAAERGDLMTDDFLINNPHLAECVLRSFEFEAEEIYYNTTETERVRRTLYRQANGYFHLANSEPDEFEDYLLSNPQIARAIRTGIDRRAAREMASSSPVPLPAMLSRPRQVTCTVTRPVQSPCATSAPRHAPLTQVSAANPPPARPTRPATPFRTGHAITQAVANPNASHQNSYDHPDRDSLFRHDQENYMWNNRNMENLPSNGLTRYDSTHHTHQLNTVCPPLHPRRRVANPTPLGVAKAIRRNEGNQSNTLTNPHGAPAQLEMPRDFGPPDLREVPVHNDNNDHANMMETFWLNNPHIVSNYRYNYPTQRIDQPYAGPFLHNRMGITPPQAGVQPNVDILNQQRPLHPPFGIPYPTVGYQGGQHSVEGHFTGPGNNDYPSDGHYDNQSNNGQADDMQHDGEENNEEDEYDEEGEEEDNDEEDEEEDGDGDEDGYEDDEEVANNEEEPGSEEQSDEENNDEAAGNEVTNEDRKVSKAAIAQEAAQAAAAAAQEVFARAHIKPIDIHITSVETNDSQIDISDQEAIIVTTVAVPLDSDDVHIARLRTRTRVGGPNASQNVYDRFLSCNSGYARRQTQRRRRLADAARNSGEASVMENRPNEAQQPAAPPQNVTFEDAIQLMTSIEGNTTFTETMISSILLSCNEATLPEGAAPITTADYENIRRRFLLGIRHQSFSGANGNSTQGIPSIASVLIHLYQGIVRRMDNVSTPIQSQVDVAGTFRRLFLTYMVRLLTVMQRESITSFPRNYRRSFANFFYDFVGMLMHIAVNGVAGFRVIFGEIINELLTNVSDRVRRHMRVVGNVLLERAVSNRVRPSSGPHRFVVRRDRLPGCFCPKDPLVDEKEEEAPAVEPAPAAPAVLPALDIAGPSGSSPLTDMDTPPPNGRQPVRSNTDDEYVDFEDRSVAEAQRLLFEALRQTTQDQEHPAGSSNDVQASQQQPDTREQEQRNPRTDRQIEEELALITGQQSDTPEPLPPLVDLSSLNPPVETTPADINEPTSTSDPRGHYSAYTRSFESLPSSSGAPFRQHFQIDHNYGLSTPYTFQGSSGVQRPRRSIPTSTVTSSCLNNNNNNNPRSSPIVMSDSPPPRLATASPANKRMKQSTDANVDSQETQRSGSGATRKTSTETAESKRKVPSSRGSDRVPSESPSSEDSSESQRRFRVEQHWEREWVSVIDADQRAVAEAPTPYSDAYLSGMTARRRRRVRQTRPPLQAAAFIHECMSAASERAVEGGEVERAVFQAFLDNFRGLTAARVNASDDFRPALHTAVQKFLTRSSSLEESTRIPNQEETN